MVFEKFTSAYLFQIAREKSCDYLLLITYRWLSRRNAPVSCNLGNLRHQLHHPGHALDLKANLIGPDQTLLFISQSKSRISMCNLHCITLFALVLHFSALVLDILHSFLRQSEHSNFAMSIIIIIITIYNLQQVTVQTLCTLYRLHHMHDVEHEEHRDSKDPKKDYKK